MRVPVATPGLSILRTIYFTLDENSLPEIKILWKNSNGKEQPIPTGSQLIRNT